MPVLPGDWRSVSFKLTCARIEPALFGGTLQIFHVQRAARRTRGQIDGVDLAPFVKN